MKNFFILCLNEAIILRNEVTEQLSWTLDKTDIIIKKKKKSLHLMKYWACGDWSVIYKQFLNFSSSNKCVRIIGEFGCLVRNETRKFEKGIKLVYKEGEDGIPSQKCDKKRKPPQNFVSSTVVPQWSPSNLSPSRNSFMVLLQEIFRHNHNRSVFEHMDEDILFEYYPIVFLT